MRKIKAQSILFKVKTACAKRGIPFTRKQYRKVKRFYTSVPWNKKAEFNVV